MSEWQHVAQELEEAGLLLIQDGNHGEYRPRPQEFNETGTAFIRAADMGEGVLKFSSAQRINEAARARIRKGVGAPLDAIISHKGTVGKVAFVPAESPHFVCSPQTTFWRSLDHQVIDPRYLYNYLRSEPFISQLRAIEHESDMAAYVSLTQQRRLSVTVPPIAVQRSIAGLLGALDDKIAVNERIAITYEQLLQCRYTELGLAEEPDPETAVPVTDFVTFNPKVSKPSADEPIYVEMAALHTHRASISSWTRRVPKSGPRFMNGDTLLARITPCLENGKTGYVDFMEDGEVGLGSTEFIVMRSLPGVPSELSYFLARDSRFREHAIRNMVGTSGRQRVSAADAANYLVNQPDADALAAFGKEVSAAFAHTKSLQSESRILATLRDTLLPQLMSGRLRVKDAEKIVEDAT